MLNKETEYTYVTSKGAGVENGDFGKNVGVDIVTEKMSIRHGGLDEGGSSSVLDDLIEGKSGIHLVSNAENVAHGVFAFLQTSEDVQLGIGKYLETVDLPNATSIGNNAFVSCSALTSINLPKVTRIGSNAFGDISPNAVINIGAAEGEIAGAPWGAPNGVTINYGVREGA